MPRTKAKSATRAKAEVDQSLLLAVADEINTLSALLRCQPSAYLFDAAAAPGKCPWDLNDDDLVGTGDLILLLGSWGDPYGTADLIELLGNWGPCPK